MGLLDTLKSERDVLKAAPWSMWTMIVATAIASGGAVIFLAQWVYGARFDAMNEQLRLKDAQLAQYSPAPVVPASPSSSAPSSSPFDPVADADKLQSSKSAWTRAFKQPSEPPAEPLPNPVKPDPNVIYK